MRIAVVGGGPGGLYFSALVKQLDPSHEVTVWERNAPDDTFGFGVVFSDETLGGIEHADPGRLRRRCSEHFARWDDIDVHHRGTTTTSGGHGFAAMSRKELLGILQRRCADLGVTVHFRAEAPDPDRCGPSTTSCSPPTAPGPQVRTAYADVFRPTFETRRCRYMWLGTDLVFEAFKFYVEETPHGVMQIHGYPYDRTGSTFIVEMHDDVWQRAFGDVAAHGPPAGRERHQVRRADRAAVRRRPRRPPGVRQQLEVAELRCRCATRPGGTATWC